MRPKSISPVTPEQEARFWSKVDRSTGPDTCWLWTASTAHGYGSVGYSGRTYIAHRIAFFLTHHTDPGALFVRHTCDTPLCCNPAHLLLGTHADNMADMCERGRSNSGKEYLGTILYGGDNPAARLTEEDVLAIRAEYSPNVRGCGYESLARKYGVGSTTIVHIIKRETWTHV